MKPHFSNQRNHAWSWFELLVVLVLVAFLFWLLLPARMGRHRRTHGNASRAERLNCVSNLKQIGLAIRIWAGDNNNQYPMQVSTANHGAEELIDAGNVAGCFQVMSQELSTPEILFCPADTDHSRAVKFNSDFNNSHVSYFLSFDASPAYPQMVLSGDDNLAVDGVPIQPGVVGLSTNAPVSFTSARHGHVGNIAFADGSVSEVSSLGFQNALQYATNGTPFATNRLAIP